MKRYHWLGRWDLSGQTLAATNAFIAYYELTTTNFFGFVCGDFGSVYEDFQLSLSGDGIGRCWMDGLDRITGKSEKWEALFKRHRLPNWSQYNAFDEFHLKVPDHMLREENQVLDPDAIKAKGLMVGIPVYGANGDVEDDGKGTLVGGNTAAPWIAFVLNEAGLNIPHLRQINLARLSPAERKTAHARALKLAPKMTREVMRLRRQWDAG